jgi:GNAT superfamily N-acetyltransferase
LLLKVKTAQIRVPKNTKYQIMPNQNLNIIVSTDKNKLDLAVIHGFLTNSYWAKGRTMEQVKKSIEHTICFGLYLDNNQIGFARVLTDKVVFAYLMDVFVLEQHRGNGYAQRLLSEIFAYPDFSDIGKWFLGTRDAHELYKKFQFVEIPNPQMFMHRLK